MILDWREFAAALGSEDHSPRVEELKSQIPKMELVEASPLGDRQYYSFRNAGVLLLFSQGTLEMVSFYLEPREGFHCYEGTLPLEVSPQMKEVEVVTLAGAASAQGGGRNDKLLGHIPRWLKYEFDNATVHIEFSRDAGVRNVSLLKK